jgi:hypothetical protein
MNQGASSNGTPWALERLINRLSEDVAQWHGGGDINHAIEGFRMLTEDILTSVGVLGEHYDTILESHDQMIGNNSFSVWARHTWRPEAPRMGPPFGHIPRGMDGVL